MDSKPGTCVLQKGAFVRRCSISRCLWWALEWVDCWRQELALELVGAWDLGALVVVGGGVPVMAWNSLGHGRCFGKRRCGIRKPGMSMVALRTPQSLLVKLEQWGSRCWCMYPAS